MPSSTSRRDQTPAIDYRHARFRLSVRPSPIHRWGVYAEEFIPKGRKVIEYTGERISRAETARRALKPLNYLFTLDSYWTLDGSVGGSGAEFINHSCTPNCRSWNFKGHILYMAERDIQPGEELSVDYCFQHDVGRVPCDCQSPHCRGAINLPAPARSRRALRKKPDAKHSTHRDAEAK